MSNGTDTDDARSATNELLSERGEDSDDSRLDNNDFNNSGDNDNSEEEEVTVTPAINLGDAHRAVDEGDMESGTNSLSNDENSNETNSRHGTVARTLQVRSANGTGASVAAATVTSASTSTSTSTSISNS